MKAFFIVLCCYYTLALLVTLYIFSKYIVRLKKFQPQICGFYILNLIVYLLCICI